MEEPTRQLFTLACTASGAEYLDAEQKLLATPRLAEVLGPLATSSEGHLERFIARVLGDWARSARQDHGEALAYLQRKDEQLSSSPLGAPRWDLCAQDLAAYFGTQLSDFLALRLLKETGWPRWKAMTALTYLHDQGEPECLPPLIRLVAQTEDAALRAATLVTFFAILERARTTPPVGIPDPAFQEAVAAIAEQVRAEGRLEGERRMLLLLLRGRFGDLPEAVVSRIEAAPAAALERWTGRTLSAARLADVLTESGPEG